jgi:chromosome segregation ATPase
MKVRTASGKKARGEVVEERANLDPVTPRMKKSYSVTKTSYLQLQLDASGKKRGNLERNLQGKEKRIAELEKEVREYQEVIVATGVNMKDLKGKYEQDKMRGDRAQSELKDAVQLCREMNDRYHQLV